MEDATAHIEDAIVYIEAATSYPATVTAPAAPGTVKPPFEPTATAHEKIAKPFLKDLPRGARQFNIFFKICRLEPGNFFNFSIG